MPRFYRFEGSYRKDNVLIRSTGESFLKEHAFIRAVGELYERVPIFFPTSCIRWSDGQSIDSPSIRSSNGLAFGFDKDSAVKNAIKELVERHVVLDSWLNKHPINIISGFNCFDFISKFYSLQCGAMCTFFYVPNQFGFHVVIAKISSKNIYNLFGFGSDLNLSSALEKAFLEAWRFYIDVTLKRTHRVVTPSQVNEIVDHLYFYAHTPIDIAEIFTVGESVSLSRIRSIKSNQSVSVDEIFIFDLSSVNLFGYSALAVNSGYHELWRGPLKTPYKKRRAGEVHPIP